MADCEQDSGRSESRTIDSGNYALDKIELNTYWPVNRIENQEVNTRNSHSDREHPSWLTKLLPHLAQTGGIKNPNVERARTYICPLAVYGCSSAFNLRNIGWRHHIDAQHIKLGFWRCDMCQPSDPDLPVFKDFYRKDLFTQHVQMMHTNHLCSLPSKLPSQLSTNDDGEISEEIIAKHQQRCYRHVRTTPPQSNCLFCEESFEGEGSWDKRIEHVGAHMSSFRLSNSKVPDPGTWRDDPVLREWLVQKGLIEWDGQSSWRIADSQPDIGKENRKLDVDFTGKLPAALGSPHHKATSTADGISSSTKAEHLRPSPSVSPDPTSEAVEIMDSWRSVGLSTDSSRIGNRDLTAIDRTHEGERNTPLLNYAASDNDELASSKDCQQTESGNSDMLASSSEDDSNGFVSEFTDYSEETLFPPVGLPTENSRLYPSLRTFGLEIVEQIMVEVRNLLNDSAKFTSCNDPSSSSTRSHGSGPHSSAKEDQASGSSNKRPRKGEGLDPSKDGRDDDSGKRQRKSSSPPEMGVVGLKLACPFFKRNPEKHQTWRSCAGPGFRTVHRVKEHVYRRHALPIRCQRCGVGFDNDDALRTHSKDLLPCNVGEAPEEDGYSKEQEKQLKSRKGARAQKDEERWVEMYRILFPHDDAASIPSPFCETDEPNSNKRLVNFKEYLKDELPKKMCEDMQSDLSLLPQWLKTSLQERIGDIARSCTEKVFLAYQKPFASPPPTRSQSEDPDRLGPTSTKNPAPSNRSAQNLSDDSSPICSDSNSGASIPQPQLGSYSAAKDTHATTPFVVGSLAGCSDDEIIVQTEQETTPLHNAAPTFITQADPCGTIDNNGGELVSPYCVTSLQITANEENPAALDPEDSLGSIEGLILGNEGLADYGEFTDVLSSLPSFSQWGICFPHSELL